MDGEKACNVCRATKPRTDFHRRAASPDGLASRCKACQSDYDRARLHKPDRVLARKKYKATPEGTAKLRRSSSEWRKRNRIKANAHLAVARALRNGSLVKRPCERCGHDGYVEAHHDDYSKPLDVTWLCDPHHKARHKELAAAARTP